MSNDFGCDLSKIPTAHITAKAGDFAKTVLMPGDPLRSRFIAQNFLENARLVNDVRGIQGYTGTYHGVPVSVMASGMGMPSMGIYSYELFNFYGVENILRVGSAGATSPLVAVRDVLLGDIALTQSTFAQCSGLPQDYVATADANLLQMAREEAERLGIKTITGTLFSSDIFYSDNDVMSFYRSKKILAVEMEAAALYANAYRAGKRALAICTISDSLVTGEALPAAERQTSFTSMMELALSLATRC